MSVNEIHNAVMKAINEGQLAKAEEIVLTALSRTKAASQRRTALEEVLLWVLVSAHRYREAMQIAKRTLNASLTRSDPRRLDVYCWLCDALLRAGRVTDARYVARWLLTSGFSPRYSGLLDLLRACVTPWDRLPVDLTPIVQRNLPTAQKRLGIRLTESQQHLSLRDQVLQSRKIFSRSAKRYQALLVSTEPLDHRRAKAAEYLQTEPVGFFRKELKRLATPARKAE
jgi:hypothetical protein